MNRVVAAIRAESGVPGLDEILGGGLLRDRIHLIHGGPGTGKTTLSFQFLLEGVRRGQRVLYISLLQTREELAAIFGSHGWSLDGIDLLELPENIHQTAADEQTLFDPAEVELHQVTDFIARKITELEPERLVFDSITELAVLVDSPYQLQRHLLRFKNQLGGSGCTTLITVNDNTSLDMAAIKTVVHSVVELRNERTGCHGPRRWLEVTKMRGSPYRQGRHDFRLLTGGLSVFPHITGAQDDGDVPWETISSGNAELDEMFGGGIESGTTCLITGTTGAGKSTLASLFAEAAAERGERVVIYCFDERKETFRRRSAGLGMRIDRFIDSGLIELEQVNVGELTPGEFAHMIRLAVEERGARVLVIDTVNGYHNAMNETRQLFVQLHEMLSYLGSRGVLTLLVMSYHGLSGAVDHEVDSSYIADTVVVMRNFEAFGRVRRCIAVLKKRHGQHENTIREVMIGTDGIAVGQPLVDFRGVLTGQPEYCGKAAALMD